MSVLREASNPPTILHPRIQQRRAPPNLLTDQYKGYLPKSNEEVVVTEAIENLNREKLWQNYISCRKPVKIDGLIQQDDWQGDQWKDPSFLRKIAGDTLVKIEPVDAVRDRFGTSAKRKTVQLSTFLDMLEDPQMAGKWYMTTQYDDDEDEDDEDDDEEEPEEKTQMNGHHENGIIPEVKIDERILPKLDIDLSLPAPTDSLAHLFPLPGPEIMGNLVLQQCNLWMGNGKSGKSSGLHHDFHDNLYMLLSGRKRLLIWPPLAHRWLEPVGKVDTVHSNGLIEYRVPGQMPLQADGLTRAESAKWLFRARLRALLVADERAARLTGEEHLERGLRKGKGKQTIEQENALSLLREAEVDLCLLQGARGVGEEESELLSVLSSQDTFSDLTDDDLFDREDDEDFSYEDEDTTDEKMKYSDGDSCKEDEASSEEEKLKKTTRTKVKRTQSRELDSQDDEDVHVNVPNKRHRRLSADKLIIPKGHLPGGLRGSLEDPQGDLDSGSDEFANEDEEGAEIYLGGIEGEELDEEEAELMTLEMRSRVLARLRGNDSTIAEGVDIERALREVIERGGDEESESGASGETDEGWPEIDPNALEEGEAALEELARLQDEKEGGPSKAAIPEYTDDPKSFSQIQPKLIHWWWGKSLDPGSNDPPTLEPSSDGRAYLAPREGCPSPIEIHLKAGQMLYLPASWYHEVTSYSDPEEPSGLHMALNYWFHPPTAIRRHTPLAPVQTRGGSRYKAPHADFSQPYLNGEVWDEIRRCVNKKVDAIRRQAAAQQAELQQSRNT